MKGLIGFLFYAGLSCLIAGVPMLPLPLWAYPICIGGLLLFAAFVEMVWFAVLAWAKEKVRK